MAKKSAPLSLPALVQQLTQQLTALVTTEVERRVRDSLGALRLEARAVMPRASRLCPVPGCGKPGAGPRNRYFCSEHARSLSVEEQRSIVARSQRLVAEGKVAAAPSGPRFVRLPPKTRRSGRALDMTCRVVGCSNRSRGPRVGFICDTHRIELTPDEQRAARDQWNARKRAPAAPAQLVPPVPVVVQAVPPIVRKAEAVAQAE